MWCLGTWDSGGPGRVWSVVRLNGLLWLSSLDDTVILIRQLLGSPDPKPTCTVLYQGMREKYQGHDPRTSPALIWSFLCLDHSALTVTSSLFSDTT